MQRLHYAGQADIIAQKRLRKQKPQHDRGKHARIAAEIPDHRGCRQNQQQNRHQTRQYAQQQPQPDAGGGGIELVRGLQGRKDVLRLLGGTLFAGLLLLEAFELTAALLGLPPFPALGTGAFTRFSGVSCGWLRIRFALIGPDGGALRLRLCLCVDGRKADGVGRLLVLLGRRSIGRTSGWRSKPDSLAGLCGLLLALRPAAELVHDLLKRVFRLLLLRRRLVQLYFVLRTPGWFHSVLHVL